MSFISFEHYGVFFDTTFVVSTLKGFLEGNMSASVHTYITHTVNNSQYQLIIGGNSVKIIGGFIVEPGLMKLTGIYNKLWQARYFSCGLLVLRIDPETTVTKFLDLKENICSIK